MDLPASLAWLVDEAHASPSPKEFMSELGRRLLADGLPLAGGALSLPVQDPIVARRSWLWRADTGAVIEALDFAGSSLDHAGSDWLARLGAMQETLVGAEHDHRLLGWAGTRTFRPSEAESLRNAARFAVAPISALAARAATATLMEAYLGRRSADRVLAGDLRRGEGETIRAVLLLADLRDFTALSESTEPEAVITILDAWFDRVAGAVHAFGGEVLKFIGDGVLAIFPVRDRGADACGAALHAVLAARAGMAHFDAERQSLGVPPLPFGVALHLGEILWGNVGAANRLDFTAIGPSVNLVSRLEGLCRPLGRWVLASGAFAAECATPLAPLGEHRLRGIKAPCAVFTLPDP